MEKTNWDLFNSQARAVLAWAERHGKQFYAGQVTLGCLLLAMVQEAGGAAAALIPAGISPLEVLSKAWPPRWLQRSAQDAEGLSAGCQLAVQSANEISRSNRHGFVGTAHLLIGLLNTVEGRALITTVAPEVNLEQLRRDAENRYLLDMPHLRPTPGSISLSFSRTSSDHDRAIPPSRPSVRNLFAELAEIKHHPSTEEIAYRDLPGTGRARVLLVRFTPSAGADDKPVTHSNTETICHILQGHAILRATPDQRLSAGEVVRIPAGVPHDFVAIEEPLVMLCIVVPRPHPASSRRTRLAE